MVCTTKLPLHPEHHPLAVVHDYSPFTCARCERQGTGTRHRCDSCDYNLHLFCGNPLQSATVLSPLHPSHRLTLYRKHCDSCHLKVKGLCYRCNSCDLDLHPLCLFLNSSLSSSWRKNELPSVVYPFIHEHPLRMTTGEDDDDQYTCGSCKVAGKGKRYRCEICRYDVHPFCGTCDETAESSLHPLHVLQLSMKRCNECGLDVEGDFYRCHSCDFDLHPMCHKETNSVDEAEAPPSTVEEERGEGVYFFMHPEHDLVWGQPTESGYRWCEACGWEVEGSAWGCEICGFHVHEDCRLGKKPAVRDLVHRNHALHYLKSKARACAVCREGCLLWRYHCNACDFHVHEGCLQGPVSGSDDAAVKLETPPSLPSISVVKL